MSLPNTMSAPVKEVLEKALEFDEHDRAEVVEALLESLEVEDPEEEAAFVAELERRAAEMESGAAKGIPWEDCQSSSVSAVARSPVEFHPATRREIRKACSWYRDQSVTAEDGFLADLRHAVEQAGLSRTQPMASLQGWRPALCL